MKEQNERIEMICAFLDRLILVAQFDVYRNRGESLKQGDYINLSY